MLRGFILVSCLEKFCTKLAHLQKIIEVTDIKKLFQA